MKIVLLLGVVLAQFSQIPYNQRRRPGTKIGEEALSEVNFVRRESVIVDRTKAEKAVTISLETSREFLVKANYAEVPLTVRVRVEDAEWVTRSRLGLDLVVVLDVSGSMAGEKMKLLKESMKFIIDNLKPSDRLGIVSFSEDSRVHSFLRRMDESGRAAAKQIVEKLVAEGSTNIKAGMDDGYRIFRQRKFKNEVNSILLLSDGQDTVGNTMSDFRAQAEEFDRYMRKEGERYKVNSFGYGTDHDEEVLSYFATLTAGGFYYIKQAEELSSVFIDSVGLLLSVFAKDASIAVLLEPRAEFVENFGEAWIPPAQADLMRVAGDFSPRFSSAGRRTGLVRVDYLSAGMDRSFVSTIGIRLGREDLASTRALPLAFAVLSFSSDSGTSRLTTSLEKFVRDSAGKVNGRVEEDFLRSRSAETLKKARADAKAGDLEKARSALTSFNTQVMASPNVSSEFKSKVSSLLNPEAISDTKQAAQGYAALQNQQFSSSTANFAKPQNRVQSSLAANFAARS